MGKTTADCYYGEGTKVAMTKTVADQYLKAHPGKEIINVTANFDFIMMLGWWCNVSTWALPIAGLGLSKINGMLGGAIAGLGACAVGVMGIMMYVCVFLYRGGESGAVCSGNYIKTDLTAVQKTYIMSSKGSFLFFLLVMQWIGVGCCALSCLCAIGAMIKGKMN